MVSGQDGYALRCLQARMIGQPLASGFVQTRGAPRILRHRSGAAFGDQAHGMAAAQPDRQAERFDGPDLVRLDVATRRGGTPFAVDMVMCRRLLPSACTVTVASGSSTEQTRAW